MKQYRFPRHPEVCIACERSFAPGEELVSAIFPSTEEPAEEDQVGQDQVLPFLRQDYCLACRERVPPGAYSSWTTRTPADAPRKPVRIDAALVFDFFQRLTARENPAEAGYVYFLALYLMRRRVLKFLDTERRDDREVWILESRPQGQRFEVADPGLGADDLEQIREHVMDALSAGEMEL